MSLTSDSDNESELLTPEFIKNEASTVVDNLLPPKSRYKYLKAYDNFIKWRASKRVKSFSESVLLVYFQELSKTLQPSTLWSVYSMLKATMSIKNNVQINLYTKLTTFLKRFAEGHKSKKSKVLTAQNIETFLNEAPDYHFLLLKVVLVFGLSGACRGKELLTLTVDNIQKHSDELLLVTLPDTKNKQDRSFIIREEYKKIVDKYQELRPTDMTNNRFFIQYHNGKCTRQVIGKNKLSSIPREIASFLNLPSPEMYTGHCFRRTSATLLADSGADLTLIKRHGGWKSSTVAEGYIEESVENKSKISSKLVDNIKLKPAYPSTSKGASISPTWTEITEILTPHLNDTSVPHSKNLTVSPSTAPKIQQNASPNSNQHVQHSQHSTTNTQVQKTTISVPNKTIHFSLHNCSNVTLNF
ncbi:uncharacterized protein [Choristoneura fumiferana]|uniref:uncharacterized protein n=1 Tax=Choristoneura fumiferana TaxID=7141 RepID=UPI003D155E84